MDTLYIYMCVVHVFSEWPLNDRDNVIQVTMRWAPWPLELCRDNCLCLKPNIVAENISIVRYGFIVSLVACRLVIGHHYVLRFGCG